MAKFLSKTGLETVWNKIKTLFVAKPSSATSGNIAVFTNDKGIQDGGAPNDHDHGNLNRYGYLVGNHSGIETNDRLVVADYSDNLKLVSSSTVFGNSSGTFLKNDGTWDTPSNGIFWVTYGQTSGPEILVARNAGKLILMRYTVGGLDLLFTMTDYYANDDLLRFSCVTKGPFNNDPLIVYNTGVPDANTNWSSVTSFSVQETLVSGTNIKTVNGSSILGSGNLQLSPITLPSLSDLIFGPYAINSEQYATYSGGVTEGTDKYIIPFDSDMTDQYVACAFCSASGLSGYSSEHNLLTAFSTCGAIKCDSIHIGNGYSRYHTDGIGAILVHNYSTSVNPLDYPETVGSLAEEDSPIDDNYFGVYSRFGHIGNFNYYMLWANGPKNACYSAPYKTLDGTRASSGRYLDFTGTNDYNDGFACCPRLGMVYLNTHQQAVSLKFVTSILFVTEVIGGNLSVQIVKAIGYNKNGTVTQISNIETYFGTTVSSINSVSWSLRFIINNTDWYFSSPNKMVYLDRRWASEGSYVTLDKLIPKNKTITNLL